MNKLYDAITEIHDEYILDAENATKKNLSFPWKSLVAVVLVVVLLAIPVHAELVNGYISNLLAPLYGGSQTEIVDKIGVPIGAEAIVGDYKLTADAIIGDRYSFAIVYSLTRVDGTILDRDLCFQSLSNSYRTDSGAGVLSHELSEDGLTLHVVEQWTSPRKFLRRNASVCFSNLMKYTGDDYELIQEGNWNLEFVIRYEDSSKEVSIKPFKVTDSSGDQYEIRSIVISPVGIHFDMTAPNNYNRDENWMPPYADFELSVIMEDDTIIEINDRSMGSGGDLESATHDADFGAFFDVPIELEKIKAIVICGTEVNIEIS